MNIGLRLSRQAREPDYLHRISLCLSVVRADSGWCQTGIFVDQGNVWRCFLSDALVSSLSPTSARLCSAITEQDHLTVRANKKQTKNSPYWVFQPSSFYVEEAIQRGHLIASWTSKMRKNGSVHRSCTRGRGKKT